MLGLRTETRREWVEIVESDLDGLLSDHAHCEVKAAHTALSLVAKYGGDYPQIVAPLSALAHEETNHFTEVYDRLTSRQALLHTPSKDGYVNALRDAAKQMPLKVHPLLDRLLISALIEARSAERFRLLSHHLKDESLRTFYYQLMASEARHTRLFRGLAESLFGTDLARERFEQLSQHEAEIADRLPLESTVHG